MPGCGPSGLSTRLPATTPGAKVTVHCTVSAALGLSRTSTPFAVPSLVCQSSARRQGEKVGSAVFLFRLSPVATASEASRIFSGAREIQYTGRLKASGPLARCSFVGSCCDVYDAGWGSLLFHTWWNIPRGWEYGAPVIQLCLYSSSWWPVNQGVGPAFLCIGAGKSCQPHLGGGSCIVTFSDQPPCA